MKLGLVLRLVLLCGGLGVNSGRLDGIKCTSCCAQDCECCPCWICSGAVMPREQEGEGEGEEQGFDNQPPVFDQDGKTEDEDDQENGTCPLEPQKPEEECRVPLLPTCNCSGEWTQRLQEEDGRELGFGQFWDDPEDDEEEGEEVDISTADLIAVLVILYLVCKLVVG